MYSNIKIQTASTGPRSFRRQFKRKQRRQMKICRFAYLKLKEGKKSVLEGVPKSLPALVKASRIQDKVAGVGFDWEEPQQVFEKLQEELGELQHEIDEQNQDKMESEFGDVLFSMINYARFLKINPENALERTNKKFIKRFKYLEQKAKEKSKSIQEMTLAEMDIFWEEAKKL